jgi:hypothetical protein
MATKNVTLLDSDIAAFSDETSPANARSASTRTRGTGLRPSLPSSAGEFDRSTELDRYPHNDYRIALVPHDRPALSNGLNIELPAAAQRMLILPFTWRELLDRVRRELHPATESESMTARFGEVRVDFLTMEISRSQKSVVLTHQEFKLLKFFLQNPQRVLSRDELLNEVWGYNHYPSTRTVDNHVWMLRRKLELQPASPVHFITVQRIGYKFLP